MNSELSALLLLSGLIATVSALMTYLACMRNKSSIGAGYWSLGLGTFALCMFLSAAARYSDHFASSVLATLSGGLSAGFILYGFQKYLGKKNLVMWGVGACGIVGLAWQTISNQRPVPDVVSHAPVLSVIFLSAFGYLLWELLKRSDWVRRPYKISAIVAFALIVSTNAGLLASSIWPLETFLPHDAFRGGIILLVPICVVALNNAMILLTSNHLMDKLETSAITDELTGILNRRGLLSYSERTMSHCVRTGLPVTVVIADIDHFKLINDTHGHAVGDEALRKLADLISSQTRNSDLIARIGGEEFVLLLPGTGLSEAVDMVERLRSIIENAQITSGKTTFSMTTSFGIAGGSAHISIEQYIQCADKALYLAKENGRNRVEIFVGNPDMETAATA